MLNCVCVKRQKTCYLCDYVKLLVLKAFYFFPIQYPRSVNLASCVDEKLRIFLIVIKTASAIKSNNIKKF